MDENKRGNSLGYQPHEIIFDQVNNQLKVNNQLNSSKILNFIPNIFAMGTISIQGSYQALSF